MTTVTVEKPAKSISIEDYEKIQPAMTIPVGDTKVIYGTPNTMCAWRVKSFFTKEPETIEWMGTFATDDVLIDVGANVGMYSIWASKVCGARVFAFEPESQNYALLNRNIVYNKLAGKVVAYCTALSDSTGFDTLHLADFNYGRSCHSFGESVDFSLKEQAFAFKQGAFATTLDALVEAGTVPQPQHIKIDVDGFEHKVIAGAHGVIADPALKSLLIEINQNLDQHMGIVRFLKDQGFKYSLDQVTQSERLEGPFKGVANYVFRR
jgi:FkbM family methyltransferase